MGYIGQFGGIFWEQTPRVLLPRNYPPHFEGEWHDLSWAFKVSPLATKASASARAEAASRSIHTRTDDFITNIQLIKRKCFNKKKRTLCCQKKMAQSDWNIFEPFKFGNHSDEPNFWSQPKWMNLEWRFFVVGTSSQKPKKNICGYVDLSVHHPPIFTARPGGRPPLPGEEVGSCGNNNLQQRFVN